MRMHEHAKHELDIIGLKEDSDEMDRAMRNHILKMVEVFSDEGHSGFSASYALAILSWYLFMGRIPLLREHHLAAPIYPFFLTKS